MWLFFFFKQKTAYEMRISDWSSDVCSSDLVVDHFTDADVADRPHKAHRVEGQQALEEGVPAQPDVTIGQAVVQDEVERHGDEHRGRLAFPEILAAELHHCAQHRKMDEQSQRADEGDQKAANRPEAHTSK